MQVPHTLPILTLTAGARAGRDSFDIYRQAVSLVFDADMEDWSESPDFLIHVDCVQLGPMLLSQAGMYNADYRYDRSVRKVAQVGSDALLVQIILEGSDIRMVKDRTIISRPGDVFLCDLTRTLATKTRNCRNFTFALPRALLGLSDLELDILHDGYLPAHSLQAKLLKSHIATLWEEKDSIEAKDAGSFAASTAGLLASLTSATLDPAIRQVNVARAEITRVQRFIEANLMEPALGPDFICTRIGLSRSALYRLFEPLDGVANYIRERRLRRVFQEIAKPDRRNRKITEVAYEYGFSNASAFTRAFKSLYGATPSEIRALSEHAPSWLALRDGPEDAGGRLNRWLSLLGKV